MSAPRPPPPDLVDWALYDWLGIPEADRRYWVVAPGQLNYREAEVWARAYAKRLGNGAEPELIPVSTGLTLVRVAPRPGSRLTY